MRIGKLCTRLGDKLFVLEEQVTGCTIKVGVDPGRWLANKGLNDDDTFTQHTPDVFVY
jgi:hypothetical protein